MPGSTPISVPTKTPMKQKKRLPGSSATDRPSATLCRVSMAIARSEAPGSARQLHADGREPDPRDDGDGDGGSERHPPALARHRPEEDQQEEDGRERESHALDGQAEDRERAQDDRDHAPSTSLERPRVGGVVALREDSQQSTERHEGEERGHGERHEPGTGIVNGAGPEPP